MANNQMLSERMTPGNWGDRYNDLFEADVSVSLRYSGYNQLEVKLFKIGVGGKTFKLFPRLFFGGATFWDNFMKAPRIILLHQLDNLI